MVETLSNTYTTQTEVERLIGVDASANQTNDLIDDAETWVDIINFATDQMNLFLERWYDPADMINNVWIRRSCTYIAAHYLFQRRGDPSYYAPIIERIDEQLNRIFKGEMQVPRLVQRDDMTPSLSNLRVDDRHPVRKIRVDPETSTGGLSARQHLAMFRYGGHR